MISLSITEVLDVTEGQLLHGDILTPFHGCATDSRRVLPGNLYIPIVGRWYNGNDFIADVMEKGASWSLISDLSKIPLGNNLDDQGLIFVDDTQEALQKLAGYVLEKKGLPSTLLMVKKRKTTTEKIVASWLKTLQGEY